MSDDYQSTINTLLSTRDTLAADLAATAAELAALPAVAAVNENGDGGSESIDMPGLRRQLMDEIKIKGDQVRELSVTIASLQAGFTVTRIRRRCTTWSW